MCFKLIHEKINHNVIGIQILGHFRIKYYCLCFKMYRSIIQYGLLYLNHVKGFLKIQDHGQHFTSICENPVFQGTERGENSQLKDF